MQISNNACTALIRLMQAWITRSRRHKNTHHHIRDILCSRGTCTWHSTTFCWKCTSRDTYLLLLVYPWSLYLQENLCNSKFEISTIFLLVWATTASTTARPILNDTSKWKYRWLVHGNEMHPPAHSRHPLQSPNRHLAFHDNLLNVHQPRHLPSTFGAPFVVIAGVGLRFVLISGPSKSIVLKSGHTHALCSHARAINFKHRS